MQISTYVVLRHSFANSIGRLIRKVAMASRLDLAVIVVLMICAVAAHADANSCAQGFHTCRAGRTCKTNIWADPGNCGKCSYKCPCGAHAFAKCQRGTCKFVCDSHNGWCNCDGKQSNGCEVNIKRDKKNCGRCGKVCPVPDNGYANCVNGVCQKTCKPGLSLCPQQNKCVKLATDTKSCGSCGTVCPTTGNNTVASCVGGTCEVGCKTGFSSCVVRNNTESECVDLQGDIFNCGSCGFTCPNDNPNLYNGTVCVDGECGHLGCFPGDATVTLASGSVKKMTEVALGDKVAVRRADGSVAYEDIYAFGHRDASAMSSFVQLTLKPMGDTVVSDTTAVESRSLELTALHFVPVASGLAGKLAYKRAQDVSIGDKLVGDSTEGFVVTSIARVQKQGLFNPFTVGGTIVVNGVVASTHSEWFLDGAFEFLGLPLEWLPAAYQAVLLPVRMLYYALETDAYAALYGWVESVRVAPFDLWPAWLGLWEASDRSMPKRA